MNSELRCFLNNYNIRCDKITIRNNAKIIDSNDNKFVVKDNKKSLNKLYKYLDSRSFDYYPKLLIETDRYNVFEYLDSIDMDSNEKAKDMMHLVGLLHAKTSYYKEIDIDDYKEIYEDTISKLDYLNNYYLDIMEIIDREVYMSPSHYLLARNINIIFSSLDMSHRYINKWYDVIKKKKKVRLVTIHNNLKLDNYLRSDKGYLLSWDKSKVDMPMYDLLLFFREYALMFPIESLFSYYEAVYPLLSEEKLLLVSLLLIPKKIEFNKREYSMCKIVGSEIDYLYRILEFCDNYIKLPPTEKGTNGKKN